MVRGFYNLTSGILTQTRRLDVIANNMTNISTAGYKAEQFTARTFDEVMVTRIGNKIKIPYQTMETYQSYALAPDQLYTNFDRGSFEETTLPLDFAIQSEEGFFAIDTGDGVVYTRAGSFTLDNDGYLSLSGYGWVLDPEGERIQLPTDKLKADSSGNLFTMEDGYLGTLGVYVFEDNGALERNAYGMFVGEGAQVSEDAVILHKYVERSNVELVKEMIDMMSTQRALQSAAQMSKIYENVIQQSVNEIGRMR